jgi:hypothetical protein
MIASFMVHYKRHQKEVLWTAGGVICGLLVGLMVGNLGIALRGGAVGVSAAVILSVFFGLACNRIGVGKDRSSNS